ncbi:MAG: autotransporter outer membrane beta-barrel domain-containing protein, partial [Pseudomonadota bacterium]
GVYASLSGLAEIDVDGGTINATGTNAAGIQANSANSNITVRNGGSVTGTGTNTAGISLGSFLDFFDTVGPAGEIFDPSTNTITIGPNGSVVSTDFIGIQDRSDRALRRLSFPERVSSRTFEGPSNNATTVDIAGTVTGGNGTAIDLGSGEDRLMLRSTGTLNGMTTLGDGEDRFAFEDGFTSSGVISGGDGMDIIEADVAMMTTRNLNLAPLPLESFEIIEKEGTGTLNIVGAAIPDPVLLQANAGLSQILADQMNLSADIAPGANLITQATMAHVTNGGSFSIGMNPLGDIATVQLTGDLVQEATGVLHVDIERPNMADLIEVDGFTTLAGTLNVNALGMLEDYVVGDEFTIIESAGGVTGEFATITDNLPDLDVTANIIPDGMTAQNVVLGLSAGDPSDKSVHPNTLQAGARAGGEFTDIVQTRARTTGSGGNAPSSGTFALALLTDLSTASGEPDAVTQSFGADGSLPEGTYAWITGYGAERDVDGSAAITGYDASLGGLAFGLDSVFTHDNALVTLGLTGGYSNTDVDSGPSSSDIETWHVGAYGSLEQDGWLFSGAIAYGFQDYDFSRSIPVGMALVTANGDADGSAFSASLAASHDIAPMLGLGDQTTFSPLVRFDHVSADRDGFTETGAGILNLTVADDDFTQSFIGLGFETSTQIEFGNGSLARPNLEVRWEHAFGDDNAVGNSAIAGVAGATFSSAGAIEDNNRAVVGAGIEIDMSETLTANINYNGTFSSGFSDHRASAGIRMKF